MKRRLGTMERALVFIDDLSPLFIVVALRLVNGPSPEVLRQALDILQDRHPSLRVQVVREKGRFYFQTPAEVPSIPLQISQRQDDHEWLAAIEAEINDRIDPAVAPLIRVRYLYSAGQDAPNEVILSCHHTIVDAASGGHLCHELLSLSSALGSGQPIEGYGPLTPAPPAEALYPSAFRGAGRLWRTAAYLLRQMREEIGYRRLVGAGRRPAVHAKVHSRFLPVQLSPDATARFVRRARREGVTLNSGLAAAELLAVRKHLYQDKPVPLRAITFTNLRPHLKPPVPTESLGAYFAMQNYTIQMRDREDLWDLARRVQQAIYQLNKRGDKFIAPLLTKALFQMMDKQGEYRVGATGLSFTEAAGLAQSYGPTRVVGLHGLFPNNRLGPEYAFFARVLFDQLCLDVFYMEEDMDRHTAQVISDEICRLVGGDG